MQPTARATLSGLGLALTLVLAGSAAAAPLSLPKEQPGNLPQIDPTLILQKGLRQTTTLTPRSLFANGASMDVHRAVRTLASENRALLTTESQLWLRFDGAASKGYGVDCKFTDNPQVHIMEYADGKLLRQARSNPVAGTLNHQIAPRSKARPIKLFFQATKNTDWSQCRITPTT